jgi:hypothetical protein
MLFSQYVCDTDSIKRKGPGSFSLKLDRIVNVAKVIFHDFQGKVIRPDNNIHLVLFRACSYNLATMP